MPWFLWQLSVILHEGLWFKGTLLHLAFSTDVVLVYPVGTLCKNLLVVVESLSPWPEGEGLHRQGWKQAKDTAPLSIPADSKERKNKFRLRAALPVQAQLQPRSLLIAEGYCSCNARNQELGREWQRRCCEPRLPPFRAFAALVLFPTPTTSPMGLAPHPIEDLSACEIGNRTLVQAGLTSTVSFLHPSSDLCWVTAPLSPEDCRNSTPPLLSD